MGLGETKEVYKYSIQENSWARVADFPGSAVMDVQCFSIGNKGYVVGGLANGSYEGLTEVWEYIIISGLEKQICQNEKYGVLVVIMVSMVLLQMVGKT